MAHTSRNIEKEDLDRGNLESLQEPRCQEPASEMLEQKRRDGGDGSQPGFSGQAVWSACPGHTWPVPSPCPLLALWTPAVLGIGSASCQGGNG